jgi:hypothetical protein
MIPARIFGIMMEAEWTTFSMDIEIEPMALLDDNVERRCETHARIALDVIKRFGAKLVLIVDIVAK